MTANGACSPNCDDTLVLVQGLKDPEAKRKAIGAEFINVFQAFAENFEKEHGITPKYLVQVGLSAAFP